MFSPAIYYLSNLINKLFNFWASISSSIKQGWKYLVLFTLQVYVWYKISTKWLENGKD